MLASNSTTVALQLFTTPLRQNKCFFFCSRLFWNNLIGYDLLSNIFKIKLYFFKFLQCMLVIVKLSCLILICSP